MEEDALLRKSQPKMRKAYKDSPTIHLRDIYGTFECYFVPGNFYRIDITLEIKLHGINSPRKP